VAGTIAPDSILKEMAELWVSLGKQGEDGAGVLRACMMTLVVVAEESEDAQGIGETLAALMPEHPSRVIVIRFRAEEERTLSSRVFAQCWMPFGQRQQICCEQIEITASAVSIPELAAAVMPLAVPDLPVILWCRSPRIFHRYTFPRLAAMAEKVVCDSATFGDPASALGELSEAVGGGRLLADFSWTRLTRWRELISQIFENRSLLGSLERVGAVRISCCGKTTPASAYYLAAWLMEGIEKTAAQAAPRFETAGGSASGSLTRVDLMAADGAETIASVGLVEGHAAEVRVGQLVDRAVLPEPTDYALMREELGIPGRDPVFERTLARAAQLALS